MDILEAQFLRFSLFGRGVESVFTDRAQVDDRRNALSFEVRQLRKCRLPTGAELGVDLQKILNAGSRRLLRHCGQTQYPH